MPIPGDLYPVLLKYAALVTDYLQKYLTKEQLKRYEAVLENPAMTYGEARRFITEEEGCPAHVFYAIEAMTRIRGLADAADNPSGEPVDPVRAFWAAFSALRAGMMFGAIVDDQGRQDILDVVAPDVEDLKRQALSESNSKNAQKGWELLGKFKEMAKGIMRSEWQNRPNLPHTKMVRFVETLEDEAGDYPWYFDKHPFRNMPVKKCAFDPSKEPKSAHNTLLSLAKEVATELQRPDLIFNQK